MRKSFLAVCSALFVLAAGCGSESTDTPTPTSGASTLKGSIRVPAGFSGTPTQLAITGYAVVPPPSSPDAMFSMVTNPVIGVGQDYVFNIPNVTKTGEFHVMAALYMPGSGGTAPMAGVDYIGWTATKVTLTEAGGEHDVGVINLQLYQGRPQ